MEDNKISVRLRQLKAQNEWTAQDMADKTAISRRTLESYMRKKNAALPGPDALRQIAEGLGISLDWLILGDAHGRIATVLLVRLVSERAALPVVSNLLDALERGERAPTPEFLAQEISAQAAEKADFVFSNGVTSLQLALLWKQSQSEMETALKEKLDEATRQLDELRKAATED